MRLCEKPVRLCEKPVRLCEKPVRLCKKPVRLCEKHEKGKGPPENRTWQTRLSGVPKGFRPTSRQSAFHPLADGVVQHRLD